MLLLLLISKDSTYNFIFGYMWYSFVIAVKCVVKNKYVVVCASFSTTAIARATPSSKEVDLPSSSIITRESFFTVLSIYWISLT